MKNLLMPFILLSCSASWLQAQDVHADPMHYLVMATTAESLSELIPGGSPGATDAYDFNHIKATVVVELVDARSGRKIHGRTSVEEATTGRGIPYLIIDDQMIFTGIHGKQYVIQAESEGYKKSEVLYSASMNKKIVVLMKPVWDLANEQVFLHR